MCDNDHVEPIAVRCVRVIDGVHSGLEAAAVAFAGATNLVTPPEA